MTSVYDRRDSNLNQALRNIEEEFLKPDDMEHLLKQEVQKIVEKIIIRALNQYTSGVEYTGSSYELTSFPGQSDFDLQLYLKIGRARPAQIVDSLHAGWKKIKGGPEEFQDGEGYLSGWKVRQKFQSALDRYLAEHNVSGWTIKRATSGPAVTLNVSNRPGEYRSFSIDVVASIRSEDLFRGTDYDLTAKPFDKTNPYSHVNLWRKSHSRKEKQLMRSFDVGGNKRRKLTLYRIFKVIRSRQPQLQGLSNYFYKNILLHLNKSKEGEQYWTRDQLGARFKDFVQLVLDALMEMNLPVFCDCEAEKENVLRNISSVTLNPLKQYLKGVVTRDDYISIVTTQ